MYDPFATPPGPYQAQQDQVMPNPAPVAPNNAMAAIYNKHMRRLMPGQPNGQFPLNPGTLGGQAPDGWRQDFQQARTDWRGDRPDHPAFDGPPPDDWRAQMDAFKTQQRDWRDLRPQRRDYRMGNVPASDV